MRPIFQFSPRPFIILATPTRRSADNPTTLSASWRMLAPIEAANGMLMFGVSTAIVFAVILRLIEAKFDLQHAPAPKIR